MASGKTENYGLNQWEATDQVERLDFNADNAKLDAALHGLAESKAEQTALEALRNENLWVKVTEAKLTSPAAQIVLNLGDTTQYQALVVYYTIPGPTSARIAFGGASYTVFNCNTASKAAMGRTELISAGGIGGLLVCIQCQATDGYDHPVDSCWLEEEVDLADVTTITLKSADNNFANKSSAVVYGLKK